MFDGSGVCFGAKGSFPYTPVRTTGGNSTVRRAGSSSLLKKMDGYAGPAPFWKRSSVPDPTANVAVGKSEGVPVWSQWAWLMMM